jgi:RNA recognition motif-containing protein
MVHEMTVYVGNLPYDAEKNDICELFAKFGSVKSVMIPTDRENNNRPRGFCFVELEDDESEDTAIRELNLADSLGRSLCVIGGRTAIITKAKPREESSRRTGTGGPSARSSSARPFNRDSRSRPSSGSSDRYGSSSREGGNKEGYSTRGSFRTPNSNRNDG